MLPVQRPLRRLLGGTASLITGFTSLPSRPPPERWVFGSRLTDPIWSAGPGPPDPGGRAERALSLRLGQKRECTYPDRQGSLQKSTADSRQKCAGANLAGVTENPSPRSRSSRRASMSGRRSRRWPSRCVSSFSTSGIREFHPAGSAARTARGAFAIAALSPPSG
jgi:hypothetical protein